jgi:hypothetical protein
METILDDDDIEAFVREWKIFRVRDHCVEIRSQPLAESERDVREIRDCHS